MRHIFRFKKPNRSNLFDKNENKLLGTYILLHNGKQIIKP